MEWKQELNELALSASERDITGQKRQIGEYVVTSERSNLIKDFFLPAADCINSVLYLDLIASGLS